MSGLYNMLLGTNPCAPAILGCLGITSETKEKYPLGRFRDVYLSPDGSRVFIYTRNYGEQGVPFDVALAAHPWYVRKFACSDPTYQTYEFLVPETDMLCRDLLRAIADQSDNRPCDERYNELNRQLAAGEDTELTRRAMLVGGQITPAIKSVLAGEIAGPVSVQNEHGCVVVKSLSPTTVTSLDSD